MNKDTTKTKKTRQAAEKAAKKPTEGENIDYAVTTAKLSDLIPDDKNFNRGTEFGQHLIEKSLRENGAGRSILLDKNNRIIAGNKTTENAASIDMDDVIIVETDGTKLVAVKRTDIDLDSEQGRQMALTMNTKKEQTPNTPEPLYKRIKGHIGRPPKFETAGDLFDKLVEYCEYCDSNPMKVDVRSRMKRNSSSGDTSKLGNMTIKRPYTLDGFCLYAGIFSTWAQFKSNAKRREDWADFETVINACEQVIRDQQITGAMIGVYSERLTARLNGITDKQELDVKARSTTVDFDTYVKMLRGENIEP